MIQPFGVYLKYLQTDYKDVNVFEKINSSSVSFNDLRVYPETTIMFQFAAVTYLCSLLSGYQRDLRWFRDHVCGEMSHQVDLSWILPWGDTSLMDKY